MGIPRSFLSDDTRARTHRHTATYAYALADTSPGHDAQQLRQDAQLLAEHLYIHREIVREAERSLVPPS